MKKLVAILLLVIMISSVLAVSPISTSAAQTQLQAVSQVSGKFTYSVLEDKTASITAYSGNDTSLTIPETIDGYIVSTIGSYAFVECWKLVQVTIPDTVTVLSDGAFCFCENLETVFIPDSVKSIEDGAFSNCSSLSSINIPASVSHIEDNPFMNCNNLNKITVDSGNKYYNSRDNCNAIINSETNTLITGCANSVIPDSVTKIGDWAFAGCENLKKISIPDSVTEIGYRAFMNCVSLNSIVLPSSVTCIGEHAFIDCTALASITIPDSVTKIGKSAFYNTIWYKNQHDGVIYINKVLYEYKGEMPENTRIEVKEGTVCISGYAFFGQENLVDISIPDSVTYIGGDAFRFTTWESNQPEGALYINRVLYGYIGRIPENTKFTVAEGTTQIVTRTFYNQSGLTELVVPASVTEIGEGNFTLCANLTDLYILGEDSFFAKCYDMKLGLAVPLWVTIHAPTKSPAHILAQENGNKFVALGDIPEEKPTENPTQNPTEKPVVNPTPDTSLEGDTDGDGVVSVMDATAIQLHMAQVKIIPENLLANGDTDNDGVVSVMDATQIQLFLAQIISKL